MEQNAKNAIIDLRRLNNAFITNLKSKSTGVEKRCVCIPIEDNFIEENGYVQRNTGKEVRTAKLQMKMWPVSDDDKQQYGKKQDFDLRLDISKNVLDTIAQRDAALHARLSYDNSAYDKELAKQMLPYCGVVYNIAPRTLDPEQIPTTEIQSTEGDDDLPF